MSPAFTVISGVLAVVLLVVLISRVKLHPFFALLISTLLLGMVNGLGITGAVDTFTDGFGGQLGVTGVVIALGAILGGLLVRSGGGDKIADVVVGRRGLGWMPLSVGVVALVIGLPNLFEVTFVLLIPLVFSIAKRLHVNPLAVGVPMAAGLMTAHGLLPPGPAPVLAATAYGASIGMTTLYGITVAIPVLLVGAVVFPRVMRRHVDVPTPADAAGWGQNGKGTTTGGTPASGRGSATATLERVRTEPSLAAALVPILIAPALMIVGTLWVDARGDAGAFGQFLDAIGNPIISLTLAVVVAIFTLGVGSGASATEVQTLVKTSFVPIVGLLLIIGAGGGLKETLKAIGLSGIVSDAATAWSIPAVLFAWIVAAIFRIALGSGTVAVSATTGIVATLITANPDVNPALLVLATCTGAMIFSHVSDGAFWLFKEYYGLTVPQTLKTWSLLVTVQSVVGLVFILVIGAVTGGL